MDLILMLLIVLESASCRRGRLTLFSLSNSVNMTACFGLRCRRMNSRMYGMSATMTESDCEARADVSQIARTKLTEMLRRDVFEPR